MGQLEEMKIQSPKWLSSFNAIRICVILSGLLLLSACSQSFTRQTCVSLPQDSRYCLAPLLNQTHSMTQKITIQVGTQQHELMGQMDMSPNNLTLVGVAPLGQALFTLNYDGHTLHSEQSILLGKQFRAEYLMAMLQLIYWPQSEVDHYLQNAQLRTVNKATRFCTSNKPFSQDKSTDCNKEMQCDAVLCKALYNTQAGATEVPILLIQYSQLSPWNASVTLSIPTAEFTLTLTPIT
ncbi:DUF3261 domain-containing protein [uncultured Shewanella sp.]|uniref:DUF3261 domain-containing protein n=1 Tax=uncultured Shewanella sp. TaxID=173975 RepID=UPI00260CC8E3|nr:DUF3261 domain-containing protein [uncultured Shewanella sp.]